MFKLKYNLLVILSIVLSLLNATLLINLFGVSVNSDAFLLATSIIIALQIILIIPVAQFLPYYNDYKSISIKKSHSFYNYLLIISLFFGIILCLIFYFFSNLLINIFVAGIDIERLNVLKKILSIMLFGIAFTTMRELNFQLLNAEMKFSIPYILEMLPNFFIVSTQLYLMFNKSDNIYLLAYAQTFAYILSVFISFIIINRSLIRFKFVYKINNVFIFFKDSFSMQLGRGIYHFILPIVLNNYLVTLSTGYVSCFYYARKIIDIVNNLMIGPSARILKSKIAKFLSYNCVDEIKKHLKTFLFVTILLFVIGMIIAYFLQEEVLKIISNNKLSVFDLTLIKKIFLSLIPWYFFMLIETPYVILCTNAKKGLYFIFVNSLFIVIMKFILCNMSITIGIYAIGLATSIAQFSNYISYMIMSNHILKNSIKI